MSSQTGIWELRQRSQQTFIAMPADADSTIQLHHGCRGLLFLVLRRADGVYVFSLSDTSRILERSPWARSANRANVEFRQLSALGAQRGSGPRPAIDGTIVASTQCWCFGRDHLNLGWLNGRVSRRRGIVCQPRCSRDCSGEQTRQSRRTHPSGPPSQRAMS